MPRPSPVSGQSARARPSWPIADWTTRRYVCANRSWHPSFHQLGLDEFSRGFKPEHLLTVPATELAMKHVGRPVPNVPLLGAFAALGGLISLEAVHSAIQQKFKGSVAQGNMAAATEAYEIVKEQERKAEDAAMENHNA